MPLAGITIKAGTGKELHLGKQPLEVLHYTSLPAWMQMQIQLINEDDTGGLGEDLRTQCRYTAGA